jgi:hypothetical protein
VNRRRADTKILLHVGFGGGPAMQTCVEVDTLRFAQLARAPDERKVFAEMAVMWLRLAERACSASPDAKERTESP